MRRIALASFIAMLFCGCAGYSIQENGQGAGYDVFQPEPYLKGEPVVFEEGTHRVVTYKFTVVWLPNYGKRYRVRSWSGLGKADFQFTFAEGWQLTAIHDQGDNSKVLDQITELAKHLLPADPFAIARGMKATDPVAPVTPVLKPVLYRIDFDADGRPACLKELQVMPLPCPAPCAR
jgi:hypothetical protein